MTNRAVPEIPMPLCRSWLLLLAVPQLALAASIYVSPAGNDAWSGMLPAANATRTDGPKASLEAAQRTARAMAAEGRGAVVELRGGIYRLEAPLRFTPADSGRPGAPVVYRAYPGERPVVSGGRAIAMQRRGELWVAALPEVGAGKWWFNQLFVNGARRPRARTPNTGYHRVAGYVGDKSHPQAKTAFHYAESDLALWPDIDQAVVTVYHSWETSLLPIKSIDPAQRLVEFAGPAAWHFGYFGELPRYVIEGVRAAFDAPGEWLLDRGSGELSYRPLPGEELVGAEVIAPATTELLQLAGDTQLGLPVEHLRFEGISWQHADWSLEPTGHSDSQAVSSLGAAITATGAVDCAFLNNELAHLGRYGIWFRTGCRRNEFRGNHLHDLGAGGVRVGETSMPPTPAAAVGETIVDNNYLHDYGQVYAGGVGIYLGQSSDNQISHNEIHDGNYSGISVGWNWGSGPTAAHRNRIEFNHIHHVLRGVLSDGGGIYTLGSSPGTTIRANHVHDVFSYRQPMIAWGIYLDAESNHITVTDNLVHHTTSGGLMMHNGAWANTVTNNIFAAGANQLIWRSPARVQEPNRFERNVMGVVQGELFYLDAQPDEKSVWDHNLYARLDGGELLFMEDSFAEWQARGLDTHSLIADPRFVDPEAGNFQLREDSPAIGQLGFRPFEVTAGLYGDAAWVALPRQAAFPRSELPPARVVAGPQPIDEGFEADPSGSPPQRARVSLGDVPGGSIAISTERAATGKQSLRVGDAQGLQRIWEPHFYYEPRFRSGLAKLRLKLWAEPGSEPWIEWRSGGYPYQVGPSLKIDARDRLVANGQVLATVPRDRWLGLEIDCLLGAEATGRYDLTLTLEGQSQRFPSLACDPGFKRLYWLGFVALADQLAAFYLDDMALTLVR